MRAKAVELVADIIDRIETRPSRRRRDCLKFHVRAITSGPKEAPHGTTQTPQHSGRAA